MVTYFRNQSLRRTINIKVALIGCFLQSGFMLSAQRIDDYFQQIRKNEAELTAFLSQMPKGGDLHNHYSGAVYGESYLNWLIEADYCVNPKTLELSAPSNGDECPSMAFSKFSFLKASMKSADFEMLRSSLIRLWSTKEYDQVHSDAREEHFFASFNKFGAASGMNYAEGLGELKKRAKAENISYLEIMLRGVSCQQPTDSVPLVSNTDTVKYYRDSLISLGQIRDSLLLNEMLQKLYFVISTRLPLIKTATAYNKFTDSLHRNFIASDSPVAIRFQAFISRIGDPLTTFINLLTAFETVKRSSSGNIVGLNIVAPEDNPVSMRDYWLHMQFFAFCHARYPHVNYSMHAGELTGSVVQPEELTWHISSAVYVAGAKRIGHGVDIAYEKNNYTLLKYMSSKRIPVEINLLSNEFILGVKDDRHPVLLYKRFNVPIIISTDDPGISRTSLTEQYVLLAKRYKEISYRDIKKYVYNTITYSFISDPLLKESLIRDLDKRFMKFENYILSQIP